MRRLGYKVRYLAARLAIARSLSLADPPDLLSSDDEDEGAGGAIRGQQLFGDGADPAAWVALVTQRAGRGDLTRKDFQALIAAHWRRGADLLTKDWEEVNADLGAFVTRLADLGSLAATGEKSRQGGYGEMLDKIITAAVMIPVGPVGEDARTGEPVIFPLNAPGGSPHMALMGGTNSGKTYTAITILRRIRTYGDVPMLAFDFKGDLSEKLAPLIGAEVLAPPRVPVPLNVLAATVIDETGLREAAGRIRESIARVKTSRISGVQSDALREAILQVLRLRRSRAVIGLSDVAAELAGC